MRLPERSSSASRRISLLMRALLLTLSAAVLSRSAVCQDSADEDALRAAIVVNITRFVTWPSDKQPLTHGITICMLGSDSIRPDLERFIVNQNVSGKPILFRAINGLDQDGGCQVLYLSFPEGRRLGSALHNTVDAGILTISASPNASAPGQIIGLPLLDDHIHIEINLSRAQQAGFSISSKLLHLATVSHE